MRTYLALNVERILQLRFIKNSEFLGVDKVMTKTCSPPKPQCDENRYIESLILMRDIGEAVDVPFFLTAGTLLGW